MKTRVCRCALCKRGRLFSRIVKDIPRAKGRKWMMAFYDYAFEIEAELEIIKANEKPQ